MQDWYARLKVRHFSLLVLFAALTAAGCSSSAADDPEVAVVALIGEPAPGFPDEYKFEAIAPDYTMGASGHIAFSGVANIPRGSARDRKPALWFGQPDELKPIVILGQAVPGEDGDRTISNFGPSPMVITRSGHLGFMAHLSGSIPGSQPQALLAQRGSKLEKVIASGDMVPMPDGETPLLSISQFAMSDAGVLLMGTYARRQWGIWFVDGSKRRLVVADGIEATIDGQACTVRSVSSTTLDINRSGLAVFRVTLGGNGCSRGGVVAWDARSQVLTPVAMSRTPIAEGSELFYQSATGDARVSDKGQIAIHANVYSNAASNAGAREMTLLQRNVGGPDIALLTRESALAGRPELKLTHTIHGDGLAVINERELVHFARSNRDRVILRTSTDGDTSHAVIANTGTTLGDMTAARIGTGQVNRNGDVVFTSYIDDGPTGGTYQQELWFSPANGDLVRLAYPGQPIAGRAEQTIERIESANQSHEPTMHNTQGGRARRMDDTGAVLFTGRLRDGSGWQQALFLATLE